MQTTIDTINAITKTISIVKIVDGIRVREAFGPGDIEKVKIYIELDSGPEIDFLNNLWTQEIIDNYLAGLDN